MACRLKQLEAAAEQLQAALLAELDTKPAGAAAGTPAAKKKSKTKKAKKKQVAVSNFTFCSHQALCNTCSCTSVHSSLSAQTGGGGGGGGTLHDAHVCMDGLGA